MQSLARETPAGSSGLIMCNRPGNLPAKSRREQKRHSRQYKSMLTEARKKGKQTCCETNKHCCETNKHCCETSQENIRISIDQSIKFISNNVKIYNDSLSMKYDYKFVAIFKCLPHF